MAPDPVPVSYCQIPRPLDRLCTVKAISVSQASAQREPDVCPPCVFLAPGSGTVLRPPSSQLLTCFPVFMCSLVNSRRGCPDLQADMYQQGAECLHPPQACALSAPWHLHVLLRNHLKSASLGDDPAGCSPFPLQRTVGREVALTLLVPGILW